MNFKNYFNELTSLIKDHYVLIIGFIVVSIILKFITIPFVSVFLMLILMYYLSETEEHQDGKLLWKIFQFLLFALFLVIFVLLFSIPGTIFLINYNAVSTTEKFANSPLIKNFMTAGVYVSMLFIFTPYRIFDTNSNVFKAIAYSCSVIINNFLLFVMIAVFMVGINLLTINISSLDYYIYLLAVILTAALYRLNVKQNLIKGDKNENN